MTNCLTLTNIEVLVLDDLGLARFTSLQQRDLLEVLEDRHEGRSTIITSQLPVEEWHAMMANPTLADALLDRLVHKAYRMNLPGESIRTTRAGLNETER